MQRHGPLRRGAAVLKTGQSGFSLAETLCALAVVSVVLLSAMGLLPMIYRQCHGGILHLRLARHLDHSLLRIEKDLRRAGSCFPHCGGRAVIIAQRRGERPHSCLLVTYAFSPSSDTVPVNETFGYRLRRGALEMQRGVTHCNGPGWVNMHDPRLWVINRLRFEPVADNAYRVTLTGAARGEPGIRYRTSRIVAGRNG